MTNFQSYHIILTLIYFTYYGICISHTKSKLSYWVLSLAFFTLVIFLRIEIPPEMSKDYIAYSKFAGFTNTGFTISSLFIEPYRYLLYEILSLITKEQIIIVTLTYYFNLFINSIFFLWVAKLRDIAIWRKMLLFSLYFIVFSFVWLRASVAYIMIGYFLYHDFRNQRRIIGFFAPLVHLSSVSIIYLWLIKYTRTSLKPILIIALLLISSYLLTSDYFIYLTRKIDFYIASGSEKDNLKHQVYFLALTLFVVCYFYFHKKYLKDKFFISLYIFYFGIHFVNVVAAQRISHYLIIALLLLPNIDSAKLLRFRKIMAFVAFIFIGVYYFKFLSVIHFEAR